MDDITPQERLLLCRKRLGDSQLEAASKVGIGVHDFIAIERGKLVPAVTPEGAAIAQALERVYGVPASAWGEFRPMPEAATA